MQTFKRFPILLMLLLFACAPMEEATDNRSALTVTTDSSTQVATAAEPTDDVAEAAETSIPTKRPSTDTPDPMTPTITPIVILPPTATPRVTAVNPTETPMPRVNEPTATPFLTVTPVPATQQSTPVAEEQADFVAVPASMETFVNTLIDDLVQQKGVQRDMVRVAEIREVVWNDGSIGCPQPDMVYTQALVDGFYIVLQADGKQYDYHTAGKNHFILCENAKEEPPSGGVSPDA